MSTATYANQNNNGDEESIRTRSDSFDSLYYVELLCKDDDEGNLKKGKQDSKIPSVINNPILAYAEKGETVVMQGMLPQASKNNFTTCNVSPTCNVISSPSTGLVEMPADNDYDNFWLDPSNSFWLQSCTELLQVH